MMTGLTLTLFMSRSNLVAYAFVWEKVEVVNFFENCCCLWTLILYLQSIKWANEASYMSIKGQGHSLTFDQGHSDVNIKT